MPSQVKKTVPFAQQQLTLAIAQLKEGSPRGEILPVLETVLAQLQSLTTHDHLTGALNRRSLIEKLDFELQRSLRTGHTFTLAMIGIDRLPEVMELHGQHATKQVLQVVTREANQMLRTLDSFGRMAATEFAIVMPTTWLDQSLKAIDRLKARLKARVTEADWSEIAPGMSISFCSGLTANAPGDSSEKMLKRVKQALEQAKAKGPDHIAQVETDLPDFDPAAAE